MIIFAVWYWEFDRGGPGARAMMTKQYPDFVFPQMTDPTNSDPEWEPQFVDYLYLSFTNATAFSPTDVMPYARWAKLTMMAQSIVSLTVVVLVVARAVNILTPRPSSAAVDRLAAARSRGDRFLHVVRRQADAPGPRPPRADRRRSAGRSSRSPRAWPRGSRAAAARRSARPARTPCPRAPRPGRAARRARCGTTRAPSMRAGGEDHLLRLARARRGAAAVACRRGPG